jgi:chromosome segregation ATPase
VEQERKAVKAQPARVVTQTRSLPNPALVERLTKMLADLRNRRTDLDSKPRPGDRLARNLDEQITQTEAALNRASSQTLREESTDVNPVRQAAEKELVTAEAQLAGFENRRTTVKLRGSPALALWTCVGLGLAA